MRARYAEMRTLAADLHIHTCLSPCAELEMTPLRIVRRAVEARLDVIAITDHNSAENIETALRVGSGAGVAVLPGMEISSAEEVHVVGLFPTAEAALRMQEEVYRSLPDGKDDGRNWQVVVNERDEVMGFNRKLLIGASALSFRSLVERIHGLGGLAIPSHVDRGAFSVSSQLGFLPEEIEVDAVEVIDREAAGTALMFHAETARLMSSDAHHMADIGRRRTLFTVREFSFEEIALALRGVDGRSAECLDG
jgi:predicted metal-dependent phosphoesterase TrpH